MVQTLPPKTRHVFDKVWEYQTFLSQIPGVVIQSVVTMREQMPNHPAFATGVCAHFLTHRTLAEIGIQGGSDVVYVEAHLLNQCRGAFELPKYKRSFPVFLASGKQTGEDQFELHPKGKMTTQESETPSLFLDELLAAVLPEPEEPQESEGSFFIVVERFSLPHGESIRCHLVWGRLLDRRVLKADRAQMLGEGGLPAHSVPPVNPNLPPATNVSPILIELEDE